MQAVQSINLIAINPKVRQGRAHIVGTGVTVADVAIAHIYHGQDATESQVGMDLHFRKPTLPCLITMPISRKLTSKFARKFSTQKN